MEITESPFFAPQRPHIETPLRRKRRGVFFASLIIHALLVLLLATVEQNRTIPNPVTLPPISAKLVFSPTKPLSGKETNLPDTAVEVPQSEQPSKQEAVTSTKADSVTQEEQANSQEQIAAPPQPDDQPHDEPAPDAPGSAQDNTPAAPATNVQERGNRPVSSLTSRQALDAFFSSQQRSAQQRDAEMAASEHRKQQISPEIVDPRKDQSEEEVYAPPPVNVDCSDTTTNVLAVIAGYTGGRVTCTNRSSGFEKFIDKRLNKQIKEQQNP